MVSTITACIPLLTLELSHITITEAIANMALAHMSVVTEDTMLLSRVCFFIDHTSVNGRRACSQSEIGGTIPKIREGQDISV
jgi:hypothetical protein